MADARKSWDGQLFRQGSNGWSAQDEWDVIGFDNPFDATGFLSGQGLRLDAQNPVAHPKSSLVYLESFDPQPAGFNRWMIKVNWSSSPRGFHPNPGNPLNDPPIYRWLPGCETEAIDRDVYGNPILNTALDAFQNSPTDENESLFLSIRRNEPIYNPQVAMQYVNKVNLKSMTILNTWTIEPGQALLKSYLPVDDASLLSTYTPCEYLFHLKRPYGKTIDGDGLWDSFKLRLLNQGVRGYYVNNSNTTTIGNIGTMVSGVFTPVSEDVRLDKNGKPMDTTGGLLVEGKTPVNCPTALPTNVQTDTTSSTLAVFLKYTKKGPIDFGGLNL